MGKVSHASGADDRIMANDDEERNADVDGRWLKKPLWYFNLSKHDSNFIEIMFGSKH